MLADMLTQPHDAMDLHSAVDRLLQGMIGHELFTMMRAHEASSHVERIYSSNTKAYPIGGRKQLVRRFGVPRHRSTYFRRTRP